MMSSRRMEMGRDDSRVAPPPAANWISGDMRKATTMRWSATFGAITQVASAINPPTTPTKSVGRSVNWAIRPTTMARATMAGTINTPGFMPERLAAVFCM